MLGIDLNDAGFTAVQDDGSTATVLPLEHDRIDLPGWIAWDGAAFRFGAEAEALARQSPRAATDRAWEDLSHRPADIACGDRRPAASELAFLLLRTLWSRLPDTCRDADSVVITLPGYRLRDDDEQAEPIGLVLGMAHDLGLPLAGLADAAVAAVTGHPLLADAGATALHLELTQHAAHLTPLRHTGARVEATGEADRRPGLGVAHLLTEAESRLAALFLARTAFDVGHDLATEIAFRQAVGHLLSHLVETGDGMLEAGPADRPRRLAVDRTTVAQTVPQMALRLAEAVAAFQRTPTPFQRTPNSRPQRTPIGEGNDWRVFLGPQAARVPGLRDRLGASGWTVALLPPGSAARGAARLARSAPAVPDLAHTPLWRSLTPPAQALPPLRHPLADTHSLADTHPPLADVAPPLADTHSSTAHLAADTHSTRPTPADTHSAAKPDTHSPADTHPASPADASPADTHSARVVGPADTHLAAQADTHSVPLADTHSVPHHACHPVANLLVWQGLAYPIGDAPFALGPVLPPTTDGLRLPPGASVALPDGPVVLRPSPDGPCLEAPARARVLVNGAPATGTPTLRPGDRLAIGDLPEFLLAQLPPTTLP